MHFGYRPQCQPDTLIKPKSLSSRADIGRELILRMISKMSCYNLFITSSKSSIRRICFQICEKMLISALAGYSLPEVKYSMA